MKPLSHNLQNQITVNGAATRIPVDCTVQALLGMLGMERDRVAVALNRDVVPRSQFGSAPIAEGDRIEILEAVGGG